MLNLEAMTEEDKQQIVKIVSFLALGDNFNQTNSCRFIWFSPLFSLFNLIFFITGLITYINLVSVKLYVKINNIFGFAKVIACLIVIFVGVYEICIGNTKNFQGDIFEGTNLQFGSIALAFYNGLWSYDGWDFYSFLFLLLPNIDLIFKDMREKHYTWYETCLFYVYHKECYLFISFLFSPTPYRWSSVTTITEEIKKPEKFVLRRIHNLCLWIEIGQSSI